MSAIMPAIPVVDVRDGGPLLHAAQSLARARALRDDCFAFFPRAATPFVPALDGAARRWLTRCGKPVLGALTS
jgi:hypothetical protein